MDSVQHASAVDQSPFGSPSGNDSQENGRCGAGDPAKVLKCNKSGCEFTSTSVNGLLSHLKSQHKFVIKYCENKAEGQEDHPGQRQAGASLGNGSHAVPSNSCHPATTGGPAGLSKNVVKSLQTCPLCSKRMNSDEKMIHLANQHLSEDLARDGVPTEPPFRCPSCPHFSPSQVSILQHWLIFHNMLKKYMSGQNDVTHSQSIGNSDSNDQFMPNDALTDEPSSQTTISRERKNQRKMECLMCDDVRVVGSTPLDLHKHLAEKHFRERLIALIPSIVNTADGRPRYCCPFPGCYYEHHYKWIIAKHYGIKHRIAKQFYDEVIGIGKLSSTDQSAATTDKLIPTSAQYSLENVNHHKAKTNFKGRPPKPSNTKIKKQSVDVKSFNYDSEFEESSSASFSSCDNSSDENEQIDIDDETLKRHFADTKSDFSKVGFSENAKKSLLCKICQVKSTSILKYLKHLSKVHYKQKLMSYVSKTAPYKCPWVGCSVIKHDRSMLSLHFGVVHGVALKLLEEVPEEVHKTVKCTLCSEAFVNQKQLLSHLSDVHFVEQLNQELPSVFPWKCPQCNHVAVDLKMLRNHYGTKHKKALDYLRSVKTIKQEACGVEPVLSNQPQGMPLQSCNDAVVPKIELIRCPKCDLTVTKHVELVLHIGTSHPKASNAISFDQNLFEDHELFPKCQMCDYRYFTRLDLCRHYVDNHLRKQIENCLDPNSLQCPSCLITYNDHQSCLRHFIWSHQDLEYLVAQNYKVRLSEFPASSKDLKMIIKMKSDQISSSTASAGADIKYLTDLAALPISKVVTLEENVSCCELCGEEFNDAVCMARQKGLHLMAHFCDYILKDLPDRNQLNCPKCSFCSNTFSELCEHYGFAHLAVFILMVRELGQNWTIDERYFTHAVLSKPKNGNTFFEIDQKQDFEDKKVSRKRQNSEFDPSRVQQGPIRCPICQVILSSAIQFLKHLTEKHFFQQLCSDLTTMECPICGFHGKDQKVLVWHYGVSHKKVFTLLNEWSLQNNYNDEDLLTKLSKQEMKPESCPLCQSSFGGHYMLLRHLADCHFREKLSVGYLDGDSYKCPECKHTSKDKGGFIRHLGLVHKWVQKSLTELGIKLVQDESVVKAKKGRHKSMKSDASSPDITDTFPADITNSVGIVPSDMRNGFNHQEKIFHQSGQIFGDGSSLQSSSDFRDSPFVSDDIFSSPNYEFSPLGNGQDFINDRNVHGQTLPRDVQFTNIQDHTDPQDPLLHLDFGFQQSSRSNLYNSSASSSNSPASTVNSNDYKIFNPLPYLGQKNSNFNATQKTDDHQKVDQFLATDKSAQKESFVLIHYPSNQVQGAGATTTVEIKKPIIHATPRPVEIPCTYCPLTFFVKNNFLNHLIDHHLQKDFLQDLPKIPPFKCPQYGCIFEAEALISLVEHYGVIHKGFNKQQIPIEHSESYPLEPLSLNIEPQNPPQVPKVVLKLICPLCNQLFGSHLDFYQHLCDLHFKDELQKEVLKAAPTFQCPVNGCGFNSMGNSQNLVYHIGISHKVVFHHLKVFLSGNNSLRLVSQPVSSQGSTPMVAAVPIELPIAQNSRPQEYKLHQPVVVDFKHAQPVAQLEPLAIQESTSISQKVSPVFDGSLMEPSQFHQPLERAECQTVSEPTVTDLKKPCKECEVCGKQFDGKNRAMLKIQHLAHHFKDQLFADLKDKSAPFKCPVEGCTYQTKHKPDWARHYGSVHQYINKYLKEYFEQNPSASTQASVTKEPLPTVQISKELVVPMQKSKEPDRGDNNFRISDGERTYSAFLPKDDLNQIISTALSQQSQTGKNFGVVTINPAPPPVIEDSHSLSLVDQVIPKIEAEPVESQASPLPDFGGHNCLICYSWFQSEELLNEHMSQHLQLANQSFLQQEEQKQGVDSPNEMELDQILKIESNEQVDSQTSVSTPEENFGSQPALKSTSKAATTTNGLVPNRSTGRPCEICGFEPKTKNKSRERQDHLAMKHYRERIQADLATTDSYRCPLCEYNGKDKQTIYRHYTGKHKVVEQYLADDIASGKIIPLAVQHQQLIQPQQQMQHQMTTQALPAHQQIHNQVQLPLQMQQPGIQNQLQPDVSHHQLQSGQYAGQEGVTHLQEYHPHGQIFSQQEIQVPYTEPSSNVLSYVQNLDDLTAHISHALEDKLLDLHPQTHDQLHHDMTNGNIAEDQMPLFDFCVDSQFGLDLSMQSPLPSNRLSMPDFADVATDHLIDVDFDKAVDQQLSNTGNLG